jgi:sugar phosphate isomerase/epimerase
MAIKLGYGTYGMKGEDVFAAATRLRKIGYEALEIAVCPGWPTAPGNLDRATRRRLREHLHALGFAPPVLLASLAPLENGAALEAQRQEFEAVCALAADLNFGDAQPIVTSTIAGSQPEWNTQRRFIHDRLLKWADAALHHGVILAIEPHVGGCFDLPDKAHWLMEHTRHPSLRLNFDFSHFNLLGLDLQRCLELCAPFAVHHHIKDGALRDGKPNFVLPGEGALNLDNYMRAVEAAGLHMPVTVEVSAMVWRSPSYDPWAAAERTYAALDRARQNVLVHTH